MTEERMIRWEEGKKYGFQDKTYPTTGVNSPLN
jgi:hypothetical protein